ncbi:MAG: glycoside hydrolase family 88 protein [Butyrivibrio sp.]|nr:glycoside hydrolase family 88 protein [Butyrivibrio sp.]
MAEALDVKAYTDLIKETIRELDEIKKYSLGQRAKDMVKSAMGRSVRTKDPMFWPAGMLMLGLAEAEKHIISGLFDQQLVTENLTSAKAESASSIPATLIPGIEGAVKRHLSLWSNKFGGKIDYIDDALAGAALLKFYELTEDEEFKDACAGAAKRMYEYLKTAPRNEEGSFIYNVGRDSSNVFADGAGQTAMFLSLYGRIFEDPGAIELARVQLERFRTYGCDDRSSLCYHGYSITSDGETKKKGVMSWGRAAGWLIMGLSEYVECSRAAGVETASEIEKWYRNFSDALISYQRFEGGFSWQVQAVEGPIDTSATGMILYGLDAENEQITDCREKASEALKLSIKDGKVYDALSSCDDFAVHYQTYGNYPWGQGAVLAAVSRM